MSNTSIDCLPNEVLIEIVHYVYGISTTNVRSSSSESDRCHYPLALLRCSKRFQALAEPIVYSGIQYSCHPQEMACIRSLPCFLRTTLSRPDLASHVKILIGWLGVENCNMTEVMAADDWNRIEKAIREHAAPGASFCEWSRSAVKGEPNMILPLLICLLPNLEHLAIEISASVLDTYTFTRCMGDIITDRKRWKSPTLR